MQALTTLQAGGTIADVFAASQRGIVMALFTAATFMGQ
jgi:hypothetical protein